MVRSLDGLQERNASYSRRRIKHRNVRFLAFPVFQRSGAPEEIRTPDPQIRSLDHCFDLARFFCKLDTKAGIAHQCVSWPVENRARAVLLTLSLLRRAGRVGLAMSPPSSRRGPLVSASTYRVRRTELLLDLYSQ